MEESVKVTNPNGANQYTMDPRQDLFLSYYLDPKSETFSNAYQSGLKAGYTDEYSQSITRNTTSWFTESVSDALLIAKATKNLDIALDGGLDDPEKGGKPLQMRATEFSLKGLQKQKWSERAEVTGKDGKDLIPEAITDEERQAIKTLLGK
jgi:hypothetical protein